MCLFVVVAGDEGIGAIVTLNPVWELPFFLAVANIMGKDKAVSGTVSSGKGGVEFESCQLPTPDFCAPSLADVEKGVAWIRAQVDAGTPVYVHCNAGKGRSSVVVACARARGISSPHF